MASWLKFFFATPAQAEPLAREILKQTGYQGTLTLSPFACDLGIVKTPELGAWMNLEGIVAYDEKGYALLEDIWKNLYRQGLCDHTLLTQFYIVDIPKEHTTKERSGYYQFEPRAQV